MSDEKTVRHWLKPEQVDAMRTACYHESIPDYLQSRNEAIITLMYDTGLRVGELVQLRNEYFDGDESLLLVPEAIQKNYSRGTTHDVRIGLAADTVRVMRAYLNGRWRESPFLFPSRKAEALTTRSVNRMIDTVANIAGIEPYASDGTRGAPSDVSPHTLRHSVGYRMIRVEGKGIYEVSQRLRHSAVEVTERIYAHLDVV